MVRAVSRLVLVSLVMFPTPGRAADSTDCPHAPSGCSIHIENAEGQYVLEPSDQLSADMLFEKSWALTVLQQTTERLEADMARKGKQGLFDHLKVYLTTDKDAIAYQEMAETLEMTEGSVRVAVHRLRRRFRRLLRDEIAQTIADHDQIDEEMGHLFSVLAY